MSETLLESALAKMANERAARPDGSSSRLVALRSDECCALLGERERLRQYAGQLERRMADIADAFGHTDQRELCVRAREAGAKIDILTRELSAATAEIEWMRKVSADWRRDWVAVAAAAGERWDIMATSLSGRISNLRSRPTREQALRAMDCWIGDNYRLGTHNSPEDCLDAAMREPGP